MGGLNHKDYFKAFLFWERQLPTAIDLIREEEAGAYREHLLKYRVAIHEKH